MKLREPIYWGKKASKKKAYYLHHLDKWKAAGEQTSELPDFYVIKNPANPHNLMDIIKISQWYQTAGGSENASTDSVFIGIAANKREAEDLAACMIEACYQRYGILDWDHLFPEEQVLPCTLS